MASGVLKYSIVMFVIISIAEVSADAPGPVPTKCMGCLCEASSGCDPYANCEQDHCGLFHITKPFWIDAGKPVLPGQSPDEPNAYQNCAMDPDCADLAIQGYMTKLGQQDCNGDGRIDCYDYMAVHKLGPWGCRGTLPEKFLNDFKRCMGW